MVARVFNVFGCLFRPATSESRTLPQSRSTESNHMAHSNRAFGYSPLRLPFPYPYISVPLRRTKNKLEGLQVLKHFVTIANGKPHLAYRRSQALAHAIDLAAKHERISEAWDLALVAIEGPNYFFPGSEASFVLYPHFGPVFLQSCAQLNTEGNFTHQRTALLGLCSSCRSGLFTAQ